MEQGSKKTIRVLFANSSTEEAESLLNIFRAAGYPTRAHHVTSKSSLDEALANGNKWDLLLVADPTGEQDLPALLDHIESYGRDIPSVVLSDYLDDSHGLDFLKQGARAVIPRGTDELLILTADREVSDLNTRRQYRRMSVALNESEKHRRALLDDGIDAIVYVSGSIVRYANPAFYQLLGFDEKSSLENREFKELVEGRDRKDVVEFLTGIEDSGQALAALQCPMVRPDGETLEVRVMVTPTSYEGRFTLSLLVRPQEDTLLDHTETRSMGVEQSVKKESKTSGLYDKKEWLNYLDVAIQQVLSGKDQYALLCISLDSIKALHAKGGSKLSQPVLAEVTKRLADNLVEGRLTSWGGGVFMAVVKAADEPSVQGLADQLLKDVTETDVLLGKNSIPVKLSLGATLISDKSCELKTLLVRVREACTQALRQGGSQLSFYQPRRVSVVDPVEKQLAGMVSQALKNETIQMLYQPVVSLKGAKFDYYEALFQLRDNRGREHDAASFRSRLDQNSLWGKVDRWQVLQAGKDLMKKRQTDKNTRMILHLGGCSIIKKEFLSWMGVALRTAGIPTSSVVIEVSEQNIVRYRKESEHFFATLRKMGCGTGVSEFGCSLKPIDNIESLKPDFVKVDPSFTEDLTKGGKGEELKSMIKALSEGGRKVIVPQVESAADLAPLWHTGVDFIQGHFLCDPGQNMDYDFHDL